MFLSRSTRALKLDRCGSAKTPITKHGTPSQAVKGGRRRILHAVAGRQAGGRRDSREKKKQKLQKKRYDGRGACATTRNLPSPPLPSPPLSAPSLLRLGLGGDGGFHVLGSGQALAGGAAPPQVCPEHGVRRRLEQRGGGHDDVEDAEGVGQVRRVDEIKPAPKATRDRQMNTCRNNDSCPRRCVETDRGGYLHIADHLLLAGRGQGRGFGVYRHAVVFGWY